MGTFNVAIQVGDAAGEHWEWVEALVDTGASYSVVSASLLRQLGVTPLRSIPLVLADGRRSDGDIGEARLRYGDLEVTTLFIFGD